MSISEIMQSRSRATVPHPAGKPARDIMSEALCQSERFGAFLETIAKKLHEAIYEISPGETREREFYNVWMHLVTAQENFAVIDERLHEAEERFIVERRPA